MGELHQHTLENQMERAVLELVQELSLMETQGRFCTCEKFQNDVAAIVLNQFRPRYATSFEGSLFALDTIQSDDTLQADLLREVARAMEYVGHTPRCQDPQCPLLNRQEHTRLDPNHIGDPEDFAQP